MYIILYLHVHSHVHLSMTRPVHVVTMTVGSVEWLLQISTIGYNLKAAGCVG